MEERSKGGWSQNQETYLYGLDWVKRHGSHC